MALDGWFFGEVVGGEGRVGAAVVVRGDWLALEEVLVDAETELGG